MLKYSCETLFGDPSNTGRTLICEPLGVPRDMWGRLVGGLMCSVSQASP